MELLDLKSRPTNAENKRLVAAQAQFNMLLAELKKHELPKDIIKAINTEISQVNAIAKSDKVLKQQLKKSQSRILKLIEKKLKLVTKHHYRNNWMAVGMALFGIPIGVAFGASLGNMAFLGIGLPLGMVMGLAVGSNMDKKAFQAGKQLQLEIKY